MKKQIVLGLIMVTLAQVAALAGTHARVTEFMSGVERESSRPREEVRRRVMDILTREGLTREQRREIMERGETANAELVARATRALERSRPELITRLTSASGALGTEASRAASTSGPRTVVEAPARVTPAERGTVSSVVIRTALRTAQARVRSGELSQAGYAKLRKAVIEVARNINNNYARGNGQGFERAAVEAKVAEMIKVLSERVDPATKEPLFFVEEGGRACEGFTIEAVKNLSEFLVEANERTRGQSLEEYMKEVARVMGRKFAQTEAQGVERLDALEKAGCMKAGAAARGLIARARTALGGAPASP